MESGYSLTNEEILMLEQNTEVAMSVATASGSSMFTDKMANDSLPKPGDIGLQYADTQPVYTRNLVGNVSRSGGYVRRR